MKAGDHIKFRNGDDILTLWIEKVYEGGWPVGWCPELKNNIMVDPHNIVTDAVTA